MVLKNRFKAFFSRYLLVFIFISTPFLSFATHIVGGSLTYVHNGGSSYTVTLKLYRDCGPGTAGFPGNVTVVVRGNNGATFSSNKNISMSLGSVTPVPSSLDPCADPPNPLPCVEEGIYTTTVNNLPPNPGEYHMYYQIIARNLSIVNINATCNCIGESFYAYIPGASAIWSEDFTLPNNTSVDNGTTAWSFSNGTPAPTSAMVTTNRFEFRGANNSVSTWSSEVINIAGSPTGVNLSVDLAENGNFENSDSILVFYRLNGGPQIMFTTNGFRINDFGNVVASETGVIGTTVQIEVRVHYGGNSPSNERYRIDNVSVFGNGTGNLTNPEFNLLPPLFLCVNQPFTFDHSATDADGDSLYYSFYTPYNGDNGNGPLDPSFPGNIATFTPVNWLPGFSATNPLGGAPLSLNPSTGLLSGTPSLIGQFVLGIKVEEYRNGVYIDETLRDFQINVLNCPQPNPPVAGSNIIINDGCTDTIAASGYIEPSVTWTSVFPGAQGDYDNFLSCSSGCLNPAVTTQGTPPPFVDYMICGTAAACNNAFICDTVRVTFNPSLVVTIVPSNPVICFGQTSTTITANGSGGTPPYSYLWNNVNPSQANVVGAGTFTVMLSDASGCPPVFSTTTVTAFSTPITADAGLDDTLCIQVPIATLNTTITGASGGIWSGGNGVFSPNNTTLVGGNYTPTAAELANGFVDLILTSTGNGTCPLGADTVRINYLGFIGNVTTTPINVSCFGGNDGTATINIVGGIPPFTYSWNTVPIQTTATATNLTPGTYFVTIQNGIGCTIQDSVTITEPTPLAINFTSTNVNCFGANDGTATASGFGGTPGYTYLWNAAAGNQTTTIAANLLAGNYTVVITDTNGCIFTDATIITEPLPLAVIFTPTNVSCVGGNDGTITSVITGGTAPYTYNWNLSGGTAANPTGLTAGTYILTITDFNNCILIDSVIITDPLLPVSATTVISDVSCFGANDGAITVTPNGGTAPYTYNWLPGGETTAIINNQLAGTYTVTITDSLGCVFTTFATINEPSILIANTNQINVSCIGGNNAIASVSVSGGTPGYAYLWLPGGQTNSSISSLQAGTYFVSVADTNGCQVQDSVIIAEPLLPLTAVLTPTPATCFGVSDGAATITASGGTSPFTYLWLPGGQTNNTITGLAAGTYIATVTDSNGCVFTDSTIITEPPLLAVTFTQTNVSCFGGNNGTLNATVTGGTAPYLYNWSPTGGNTPNPTGLAAGTYILTITDANNWVFIDSVIITEPIIAVSGTITTTTVSCSGGNDGTATVLGLGGTSGYTYLWNVAAGNQTTTTATNLSAGTYTVVITDANGCAFTDTAIVIEPIPLNISFNTPVNVSCFGDNDGAVSVLTTGGTPNYNYSWLPGGATTNTISGLIAGNYTVTVTDANGCQDVDAVIVTEPLLLTVNFTFTEPSCNGGSDGSATATGSGGTAPYSYTWLQGGQNTNVINGQTAGTYTVMITDANGCTAINSITITEPAPIILSAGAINSACGLANGLAFVSITSGGTAPFTYLWSPVGGVNDTATGLFSGAYTVLVTDASGCTATAIGNVNDNAAAIVTISATNDVSCFGGSDGDATVSLVGGIGPFTYLWSPSGDITATATGLSSGIHSVTVTGSNGCQSFATTPLITEPDSIITSVIVTDVNCFGGNDGTASASSIGGTAGYSYQWLPGGSTGNTVSNLSAGTDSILTTDANGCTQIVFFSVSEPLTPVSAILSFTPVSCNGGNDGTVSAIASGGTAPYAYNWTPGNIAGSIASNLTIGTYTVEITDANGCLLTNDTTVTEPALIALTVFDTNSTCGLANGGAFVSVIGGTAPYSYSWLPLGGNNATATGLLSGSYTVTVTDDNGCAQIANITINDTPGATVTVNGITNVSCNGGNDGTATANVVGGTAPFTYLWSPSGSVSATATGLSIGAHSVTVTDFNGCLATAISPIITEPNPIITSIVVTDVNCFGDNDGTASATSIGGTGGYSYQWLPGGSTGISVSNLFAGTDSVLTTDANGCTNTALFTINEPTILTLTTSSVTDVNCFGGSDGAATITVNGGTPFYTYSWSPTGGNNATATGLSAGNYIVTIIDFNSCSATINVTISEPTQALSATSTVVASSCFGGSNGFATINPVGGTAPYSYLWSPFGGTNQTETGLTSGNYTVLASDIKGCQTNVALTITPPPVLTGVLDSINPSCGLPNGSVLATVSGGTAPYSYDWTPGGSTNSTISNLNPGTYSVDITDDLGCLLTLSTTLTNIVGPTVTIPVSTNVSCFGGNNGTATATIISGTSPFNISWSPFGGNNITATSLIVGTYTVNVTDSLGCIATDFVVITEPTPITLSTTAITPVSCFGGSDGTITVLATGGTGTYTYSWSPNVSSSSTVTNLAAGVYVATVTDQNSCSKAISITISEPTLPLSSSVSVINPICSISTNGTATVNILGGTIPYTYLWSNGQTGSTSTNLIGGAYTVTITDANGCTITDNAIITQPGQIITNAGVNDTICLGQPGTLVATAIGGAGNYSYSWQPVAVTNAGTLNITPIVNTTYTVIAFDQNGCPGNLDTVLAVIISLDSTNIEASVTASLICLGQNTEISVQQTGLFDSLVFTWNNGLGTGIGPFIVSPTQPTTYIVTATNACGAIVKDSVLVDFSPLPVLIFNSDNDSVCNPATIQFFDNSTTGNPEDQLHFWSWNFGDGNTSQLQDPIHTYTQPGAYQVTLTVTTGNGCTTNSGLTPLLINVYPTPFASFTINATSFYLPTETLTTTNTSSGATIYDWSFGDGATSTDFSPDYLYTTVGDYQIQLIATNRYGCSDTALADIVTNADLIVPNAFTPNNGGPSGGFYDVTSLNNDIFFPYTSGVVEFRFEIFNRWGELIFSTIDFKQGWDGYYRGQLVEKGVYIWKIYAKLNNDKIFNKTGDVTLLR